jgi:protein translocase SEC61 complex gamma subunit
MVDILESSQRFQDRVENWLRNRRRGRYMRVLRLAVRPEKDEYANTLKLAFAGLLVLGFTGFVMQLGVDAVSKWLGSWLHV